MYENLSRESYGVSEAEIISALSILEKRHRAHSIFISPLHLKRLMQKNDIFRKKSPQFKTEVYDRINNHNHCISKEGVLEEMER